MLWQAPPVVAHVLSLEFDDLPSPGDYTPQHKYLPNNPSLRYTCFHGISNASLDFPNVLSVILFSCSIAGFFIQKFFEYFLNTFLLHWLKILSFDLQNMETSKQKIRVFWVLNDDEKYWFGVKIESKLFCISHKVGVSLFCTRWRCEIMQFFAKEKMEIWAICRDSLIPSWGSVWNW